MREITIIGAGSWGTTLALVAYRAGNSVSLVSSNLSVVDSLQTTRHHPRVLSDITLPDQIEVAHEDVVKPSSRVILAVPTQQLRRYLRQHQWIADADLVVCAAKGIELESLKLPLEIIAEELGESHRQRLVALSGPNLAGEIAHDLPAASVVASESLSSAEHAQHMLNSPAFRLYTSSDVTGVQCGGALKNVIAIAAGMCDELGLGENAKSGLVTRGLAEITRIGVALGADARTFAGLSGLGDLMATCSSSASRNHTVGRRLAHGESLDHIIKTMHETAEGVDTTRAALKLAQNHGIEVPITEAVHRVLFDGLDPSVAVAALMTRTPTQE